MYVCEGSNYQPFTCCLLIRLTYLPTYLQLLAEALEGPVGWLLTDEGVWEVVQTCFVNRNEVAHSRMLCHAAEEVGRYVGM